MSDPAVPQHPITALNVPVVVTSAGPSQSSFNSCSSGLVVTADPGKSATNAVADDDDSQGPRISADAEDKRGGGRWTPEVSN